MSTTTLRLPDTLRARMRAAAKRAGVTPHAYALAAILERTEDDEKRAEMLDVARARWDEIATTGQSVSWQSMRTYLEARAAGKKARRPAARKLGR
jgi:hypothetical protein